MLLYESRPRLLICSGATPDVAAMLLKKHCFSFFEPPDNVYVFQFIFQCVTPVFLFQTLPGIFTENDIKRFNAVLSTVESCFHNERPISRYFFFDKITFLSDQFQCSFS